ncbi:DUF3078 domain-containing protein, partial [Pseudoxanthomonas sp. SGD-10]
MSILLRVILILGFLSSFTELQAQSYNETDTIKTQIIYPQKNSFLTRRPHFTVKRKALPFYLTYKKVNYWKSTSSFGINLNQATFSDNWSSGGVNSIALSALVNYKAEYKKDLKNLSSELILQYGKLKNKDQMERKTNDRIFWDNKASLQLSKSWYFFGSVSFESQFDAGYTYPKNPAGEETKTIISKFLAPAYITESLGFEYKPEKYFSMRLGTGTARQTLMLDTSLYKNNAKNFGVPIGKKVKNELAFQVVGEFNKDIATNMNLKARYLLFASYEKLNNIDQRLDMTLTAKVNRVVNVTINGTAMYDDDFSGKIQSMQSLAMGIVFKF